MQNHVSSHYNGSVYTKIKKINVEENDSNTIEKASNLNSIIDQFFKCPLCDWKSTIYSDIEDHFRKHFATFDSKIKAIRKEN